MDLEFSSEKKEVNQLNKYDLLFFPEINNNFDYEKNKNIVAHFIEKNHRVFYCNIVNSKETELLNEELILIALNNFNLHSMNRQLDEVIRQNKIIDCVLIVEDPNWQPIIVHLKKLYGFKVIFNYSQKSSSEKANNLLLFQYDNTIFELSDEIIIFSPELYNSGKIKSDGVNIIDNECTPEYIESIIKKSHKLVSIIIVTFNNLIFTKQCLSSIFAKTAYPNYEIIIVDNYSQDETADYLLKLEKKHSNVTIIFNEENAGFAKANNIGICHAKGDYIILLNNDTVVTKGWITGFIKHLDRHKELGLIGPVTNGAGNESKIDVDYNTMKKMDVFAEEYTTHNFNKLYVDLRMLAMFCVAMKRKIIDEIGYLDESFGIGMFEDDDYSYRVKLKGYKIACVEDVFIHHYGRASFEKINSEEYKKLFDTNKRLYEEKWHKSWIPHKYRNLKQDNQLNSELENKVYDIMFFSIIDWDFRYQRPQHLAYNLAKNGNRVFYFNAMFSEKTLIKEQINNLKIVSLSNKLGNNLYFADFNYNLAYAIIELDKLIKEEKIQNCIVFVEYPNWYPIMTYLMEKYNFKVIVDYLDNFTDPQTTDHLLLKYNDKLLEKGNIIIATSEYLYEKAKKKNDKVTIVRNGTEYLHFNKEIKNNTINKKKRPIVGYYGAIAKWFDVDKVLYLAKIKPEWDIVLIGDISIDNIFKKLKTLPNIKLLGEKNYRDIPQYLKQFDVCIIPFLTDLEIIKATNPVKFYEYLSEGKKIVATEMPELEPYRNKLVYLSNDNEKFLHYIELCLENRDSLAPFEERLTFAQGQDWSVRISLIESIIQSVDKNE